MSLTVKGYLTRAGSQEKEIRRFTVDQDVSTNFIYLTKKVVFAFPALQDKTFHLRWKDAENDLILFSSDEELTQALGFVDDGVFKIYIEEVPETGSQSSEKKSTNCEGGKDFPHPGVQCDGCEGPIFGIRFKCQMCPNFDLCSGCRETGLHAEHAFDDISTPVNPFNMFGEHFRGFAAAMPQVWFQGGTMPPMPPMFQHWAQEGNQNQGNGSPLHGGCRGMRKAWRKWCREIYGKKHGKRHGCARAEGEHGCTRAEGENKDEKMEAEAGSESTSAEKDAAKEKGPESKEKADIEESDSSDDETGGENYLEAVGKTVTDFLRPLGIDIEAFIAKQGTGSESHARPSEQQGGPSGSSSGQSGPHCGPGGPSRPHCNPFGPQGSPFGPQGASFGPQGYRCGPQGVHFGPHGGSFEPHTRQFGHRGFSDGPRGFSHGPRSQSFGCHGRPWGPLNESFGPRGNPFVPENGPSRPEGSSSGPQGSSWGYPFGFGQCGPQARPWGPYNYGPNENASASGAFSSQGQVGEQNHQGHNTGNDHSGMEHDNSQTADSSETRKEKENGTPSAMNDRPQNNDDRLIAETIETMKRMGFNDDGGWLSTLVTAHKGDIGCALDAIHAIHAKRPQ